MAMPDLVASAPAAAASITDEELVIRVLAGQRARFATLVRRHNQRLFRIARAILRQDDEAEDVVQQAYVIAFHKLAEFRGEAAFGTWLARIVVNEARGRLRRDRHHLDVDRVDPAVRQASPEDHAACAELRVLLERHIDDLPEGYRAVLVLRDVQEMTTAETAEWLGLSEEAVRVRLHRARLALQAALGDDMGPSLTDLFRFDGPRCDRITAAVLRMLGVAAGPGAT
jgi:RNA polymerase sigma-70 factor (ECF subfamily)